MKIGNLVEFIKTLFNIKHKPKSPNPKLALDVLREAKDLFLEDYGRVSSGMCIYLQKACYKASKKYQINIPYIEYLIPEFNRDFLEGSFGLFWWPLEDKKSRLEAFDKLIAIYEEAVNNKVKIKSK